MKCVIINNSIVTIGPIELSESEIQEYGYKNDLVYCVENIDPVPNLGWHYINGILVDPDNVGNSGVVLLTQFAFFNRFTITEMANFEGFMDAGPTPYKYMARGFKTALMIASYIDRSWQSTKSGMYFLVQVGVLSQTRHDEIMNTPAQPNEIYRGKK